MTPETVYVFVEGDDDERFVEHVVTPIISTQYRYVKCIKYACDSPKKTNKFLSAVGHCIFLHDRDDNPCIAAARKKVLDRYNVSPDCLCIVSPEIEAWYLAGVRPKMRPKIPPFRTTDGLTKEQFNNILPHGIDRTVFKLDILDGYCLNTAIGKNASLRWFVDKFLQLRCGSTP